MKPRIPSSARFPNILLRFFIFAIFHFSALTNGDAAPNPKATANADADPQTTYVIPFTGAIFITVPNTASPAVPAVCPADHPTSCKNIGKQGWCCVSGNNCALDQAGNVGCCPYGQTCTLLVSSAQIPAKREVVSLLENCREIKLMTGYDEIGSGTVAGYNYGQANPTTWVPTATYYQQPWNQPTTYIVVPAAVVYTTQPVGVIYQGYCSTLYATGPNLPTTRMGQCGPILVLSEAGRRGVGRGDMVKGVCLVLGVHVVIYSLLFGRLVL